MYDPPASPRFRYPAPLDEDDDLPTTPGGGESSLFTTTANPLTKPPLAPFRGAWAETPRSPLKRGKAGSDERRGATPTKLAKSPARRRVLSDLYGRLTVATEREPFEGALRGKLRRLERGKLRRLGRRERRLARRCGWRAGRRGGPRMGRRSSSSSPPSPRPGSPRTSPGFPPPSRFPPRGEGTWVAFALYFARREKNEKNERRMSF
jgi:hypothetical protein